MIVKINFFGNVNAVEIDDKTFLVEAPSEEFLNKLSIFTKLLSEALRDSGVNIAVISMNINNEREVVSLTPLYSLLSNQAALSIKSLWDNLSVEDLGSRNDFLLKRDIENTLSDTKKEMKFFFYSPFELLNNYINVSFCADKNLPLDFYEKTKNHMLQVAEMPDYYYLLDNPHEAKETTLSELTRRGIVKPNERLWALSFYRYVKENKIRASKKGAISWDRTNVDIDKDKAVDILSLIFCFILISKIPNESSEPFADRIWHFLISVDAQINMRAFLQNVIAHALSENTQLQEHFSKRFDDEMKIEKLNLMVSDTTFPKKLLPCGTEIFDLDKLLPSRQETIQQGFK
tara:strand:- start:245 stop:1282 length:1038 start_codon:yes stop_codon:yes gene_type:complete